MEKVKEIKKEDLRVGNWVLRSVTGDNYKPYEICNGYEIDSVENHIPLPLTDELIERLGFTRKSASFLWLNYMPVVDYGICLRKDFDCYRVYVQFTSGKHNLHPISIKSLHELQNVFYYIIGKELAVKHSIMDKLSSLTTPSTNR